MSHGVGGVGMHVYTSVGGLGMHVYTCVGGVGMHVYTCVGRVGMHMHVHRCVGAVPPETCSSRPQESLYAQWKVNKRTFFLF